MQNLYMLQIYNNDNDKQNNNLFIYKKKNFFKKQKPSKKMITSNYKKKQKQKQKSISTLYNTNKSKELVLFVIKQIHIYFMTIIHKHYQHYENIFETKKKKTKQVTK